MRSAFARHTIERRLPAIAQMALRDCASSSATTRRIQRLLAGIREGSLLEPELFARPSAWYAEFLDCLRGASYRGCAFQFLCIARL